MSDSDRNDDDYEDPRPKVLDNGLPVLPAELDLETVVPVARWVDGDFGVVLSVQRNEPWDDEVGEQELRADFGWIGYVEEDEKADDEEDEEVPEIDDEHMYDIQPYVRINGEWQTAYGGRGSNWFSPPLQRPFDIGPLEVRGGHEGASWEDGKKTMRLASGVAGENVKSIETHFEDRVVRMDIESPIGAWVAGVQGDGPAKWIARDESGRIAAEGTFAGKSEPPTWHQSVRENQGDGVIESSVSYSSVLSWDDEGNENVLPEGVREWFGRQSESRDSNETYIESTRVPEWQRIAADLRRTLEITLEIRAYPSRFMPDAVDYEVWIDGTRHSSFGQFFEEGDAEVFLSEFAEVLVAKELPSCIEIVWPLCPEHETLPLRPRVDDNGTAVWGCSSEAHSWRIGELQDSAETSSEKKRG